MKRLYLLSIPLFVVLFVGCSYNELPAELGVDLPIDERISLNVETRAEVYNGEELDREYFVTATDLENFVQFRRNTSKRSNFSVKEVKSYGFDSSQTLFYILNYDEGWEVVAADKRVQPTLAHGDSGEFTMECDNEPMKFWMNMLADGVLQTRQRSDDAMTIANTTASTNSDTTTPSTSEKQYVDFWESISPTKNETKGGHLTPIIGPTQPIGEYIYQIDEESYISVLQDYGDLIVTEWGQSYPWNTYCPLRNDGSMARVPAGCVAISASQMLYFLQNKYDLALEIPTACTCIGSIPTYERTFSDFSSNIWDDMALFVDNLIYSEQEYNNVALLIAYVGELCNMNYGNYGSGASTMYLPESVFDEFGIECKKSFEYNSSIVSEQLKNHMPIIIRGQNQSGSGHSWLIDGIRSECTTTIKYFKTFDTEKSLIELLQYNKEDADYHLTSEYWTSYLRMDWGWNGIDNDDNYALLNTLWDDSDVSYRYNLNFLYDFTPVNQ